MQQSTSTVLSSTGAAADAVDSSVALPYHVLMVPSPDQLLQRRRLFQQRLEKDYISRRYKSLQEPPKPANTNTTTNGNTHTSATNGNAASSVQQPPPLPSHNSNNSNNDVAVNDENVWRGTLGVERSLVECCEVPASWEEAATGGALAKGKEIRFLGLLASSCNNAGTRALALAILERTIRKDEKELENQQQHKFDDGDLDHHDDDEEHHDDDDDVLQEQEINHETNIVGRKEGSDKASQGGNSIASSSVEEFKAQGDQEDANLTTPQKARIFEGGSQNIAAQPAEATTDTTPSSVESDTTTQGEAQDADMDKQIDAEQPTSSHSRTESPQIESEEDSIQETTKSSSNVRQEEMGRIDVFLAAGGLSLLNQWFKEAITPVLVNTKASSPPSQSGAIKKVQPLVTTRPSPTGPILLVLLSVLEKIPFEKKLVVETKINKQIRKLSKHVDAVLKSAGPQADITDPVAGGLSVVEVKKAVDTLKMTWEEQARSESDNNSGNKVTVVDPFAELKAKMAERLDILNRYEAGELPKPEWLARFDQTDKSHNNNESKKRKVKASISELQAREHQEERKRRLAVTKQQLRVAQLEKVKVYNQLRELQKKMSGEEALTPTPKTTKSKTVTWKDGLKSSGVSRVRKLLEQVHYYDPYELDDGDQEDALDDAINMEDVALEIPELEEQASDRQFDDVMDEAELANNNCDPINDEGSPDEELTEQPWV